jgi:hypothetical protein
MRRNLKIGAWVEVLHGGGNEGTRAICYLVAIVIIEPVRFTEFSPIWGVRLRFLLVVQEARKPQVGAQVYGNR